MKLNKHRWISRAVKAGSYIGFSPSTVTEDFHIVMVAFGDQWLEREAEQCDVRAKGIFSGHPLIRHLSVPDQNPVSAVVELATYFKTFAADDGMSNMITKLKSAGHYENHLLELAFAFRLKRIGVDVHLEPRTSRGLGDIEARYEDTAWLIECTRQNVSQDTTAQRNMLDFAMRMTNRAVGKLKAGMTAKVILKQDAGQSQIREIRGRLGELAVALRDDPDQEHKYDDDFLAVSVKRFDDEADPHPMASGIATEWDTVMDLYHAPREHVEQIEKGYDIEPLRFTTNRVFLRVESAQAHSEDIEAGIISRAEKKLSQTASEDDNRPRLIVIQTLGLLEQLDMQKIKSGIRRIFDHHHRLAGISLVDRRYVAGRHRYAHIMSCNDIGDCPFPVKIFDMMKDLEDNGFY